MARGVDAVLDVDHAPVAVQALPVSTAVTRRPTVVDVDYREPAARPVLVLECIRRTAESGWAAVTAHHQRRLLPVRRIVVVVAGRVERCVGGQAALGRKPDPL